MSTSSRARSHMLFLCFIVLLSSSASAFNITRLLGRYPNFNTFNGILSQTHLNDQINSRLTITVLAIRDENMDEISGKPVDVAKKILSNHVILDYYDLQKLENLSNKTVLLTTLFQATGEASSQQGFLNVTDTKNGIFFGSAVEGAALDVKLEGSVAAQPYNISVLEVSGPLLAPGVGSPPIAPTASPPKSSSSPASAPQMAKKSPPSPAKSPAPAVAHAPITDDAPSPSGDAPSPSVDASATVPPSATPESSPSQSPSADTTVDASAPSPSNSTTSDSFVISKYGFCSVMLLLVSFFAVN